MDSLLVNRAIKSALAQDWKEAIRINQTLLETNTDDVASLNRLAFAYIKSGSIASAKSTYRKVLKIDKYNPIALKNLKWLSNITREDIHHDNTSTPNPTSFIEEPGKTRIVTLINAAPIKILCNVMTAQQVLLYPKKRAIEVRTHKGVYLGALPDDLSHRLLKFISAGNTYEVYVKNIQKNTITVFIREIKRVKALHDIPSFSVANGLAQQMPYFLPPDEIEPEMRPATDTEE